ncbi:MAG TPA: serine/threonine-protein kinase, partial [Polyangiaceae bacterium]|nr:serine/threonine-protein kinase [Polyangiaceae bacterium]
DDQFEQMFLDEASLASQIKHPHAVEILDLGEQEGVLFLVMEWIDGVPLNRIAKVAKPKGGVPLPIAVRVVMQASAGLHAAHELRNNGELVGLVHRDVSPQNILVTGEGVTKVVDFGVAKATALGGGATIAGQVKGKISYMSPEQARGDVVDRRTDVFALGTVLYALTTGKHPFRRDSEGGTMMAICSDEPVLPPSKVQPGFPESLEAVLLKALEKDASKRYASANDFFKALDQLPTELRASSDEDVSAYIRSLVGSELDERRAQLQAALERRNQGMPAPIMSLPPPESRSRGSLSSMGSFSVVGTTASLRPGDIESEVSLLKASRQRRALFAALVLALIAVTGALAVFMLKPERSHEETSPVPPHTAPSLGAPGGSVPKVEGLPPQPAELGEPAKEPAAPIAPALDLDKPGPVSVKREGGRVVRKESKEAAPKPSAKPANTWRTDPGF